MNAKADCGRFSILATPSDMRSRPKPATYNFSTGKLDSVTAGRITNSVIGFGRLPRITFQTANILKRLRSDKKTRQGQVRFVLPREIGKVEITSDVPEAIVRSAVDEIRKLAKN